MKAAVLVAAFAGLVASQSPVFAPTRPSTSSSSSPSQSPSPSSPSPVSSNPPPIIASSNHSRILVFPSTSASPSTFPPTMVLATPNYFSSTSILPTISCSKLSNISSCKTISSIISTWTTTPYSNSSSVAPAPTARPAVNVNVNVNIVFVVVDLFMLFGPTATTVWYDNTCYTATADDVYLTITNCPCTLATISTPGVTSTNTIITQTCTLPVTTVVPVTVTVVGLTSALAMNTTTPTRVMSKTVTKRPAAISTAAAVKATPIVKAGAQAQYYAASGPGLLGFLVLALL